MIEPITSPDGAYIADLSSEFDGRDPELDRVYYTIRVVRAADGEEVYRTRRHWVADQIDEFQRGMKVDEIGFDETGGIVLINGGLAARNCVPFSVIVATSNRLIQRYQMQLMAYRRELSEGSEQALPQPVAVALRKAFNGMGEPHDWLAHFEAVIETAFDDSKRGPDQAR